MNYRSQERKKERGGEKETVEEWEGEEKIKEDKDVCQGRQGQVEETARETRAIDGMATMVSMKEHTGVKGRLKVLEEKSREANTPGIKKE